jgi:hypothetical protein
MLRAKLRKTLEGYGRTNGHACPPSASNVDPIFHELYVTSEAMTYFKSRYEAARDKAMEVAFDNGDLDKALARVIKNNQGEALMAAGGELYAMTVDISRAASRLDATALRNALMTEHGMTRDTVDALFDNATTLSTPAKRVKVVGR